MSTDFPELETESDTSLLEPDLHQLRLDRLDRNRAFLQSVNPRVASKVFPSVPGSVEDVSATTIQRWWRGYKGRKIYTSKLYESRQLEVLLEDNKTRRRNAARFILSKVIINILRSRSTIPTDDISSYKWTPNRVHKRIQRFWRKYLEKKHQIIYQLNSGIDDSPAEDFNQSNSNVATTDTKASHCDFDPALVGNQISDTWEHSVNYNSADKSFHSDDESENAFVNPLADSDEVENVASIDSEQSTASSHAISPEVIQRLPHETDEQFFKRQRKLDFLAQALEFVQQKKVNTDTLLHAQTQPAAIVGEREDMSTNMTQSDTNLDQTDTAECHCDNNTNGDGEINKSTASSQVIETSGEHSKVQGNVTSDIGKTSAHSKDVNPETTAGDKQDKEQEMSAFDVYNIETALPNIDWGSLEEKLKAASEEEKRIREARRNDREEIRKKLAMGEEEDYYEDDSNDDIGYKKPSFHSRLHSGLQICFMNESPGDTDSEGRSPRQHEFHDNMKLDLKDEELVDSDNNLRTVQDLNQTASTSDPIQNCSPPRLKPYKQEEGAGAVDFHSRQEQLQNEAKLALAQAGTMAHMQLEIEKQLQKKSPMAEIVGIPGLGERRRKKLSIRQLQEMNLAQIQVLYNDLHTQIENLNEELVHLLMERDELHMEQDSMLVDIEDLTRRAEELAEKGKDVKNNIKGKLPTR